MEYDHRTKPRRLYYQAFIQGENGAANRRCHLEDVSEGGARLRVEDSAGIPAVFSLLLSEGGVARPCRVIWRSDSEVGLRFDQPASRSNALKRPLKAG